MEWLLLILFLILIAAAVWYLLRPKGGDDRAAQGQEQPPQQPGAPTGYGAPTPYDQGTATPYDQGGASASYDQGRGYAPYDQQAGAGAPTGQDAGEPVGYSEGAQSGYTATGEQTSAGQTGYGGSPPPNEHAAADESYAPATDEYAPATDELASSDGTFAEGSLGVGYPEDSEDATAVPPEIVADGPQATDAQPQAQPGAYAEAPATEGATVDAPAAGAYGPGSADPEPDGSGPAGWTIKGNVGSMLFHTEDSPSYPAARADVWFQSEEAARNAGFVHWDRKKR